MVPEGGEGEGEGRGGGGRGEQYRSILASYMISRRGVKGKIKGKEIVVILRM